MTNHPPGTGRALEAHLPVGEVLRQLVDASELERAVVDAPPLD